MKSSSKKDIAINAANMIVMMFSTHGFNQIKHSDVIANYHESYLKKKCNKELMEIKRTAIELRGESSGNILNIINIVIGRIDKVILDRYWRQHEENKAAKRKEIEEQRERLREMGSKRVESTVVSKGSTTTRITRWNRS